MTISSVYPSSSFFYNEFSFLGETALDVRIEERERERERERKGERKGEKSRGSIYSTNPQKSLYYCLLVRVYSFFLPLFFLLSSSFFSRGKQDSTVSQLGSGEEETNNRGGGTKPRRDGGDVVDV